MRALAAAIVSIGVQKPKMVKTFEAFAECNMREIFSKVLQNRKNKLLHRHPAFFSSSSSEWETIDANHEEPNLWTVKNKTNTVTFIKLKE